MEQVEPGLAEDLAAPSCDDAEVGSDCDGIVDVGSDLGEGDEGGSVLKVEHLAVELLEFGLGEDWSGRGLVWAMAITKLPTPMTENLVWRLVEEGEAASEMGLKKA
ncbi:hypothetical protein ACE6H2_021840 [Prunus campanulata]